MSASTDRAFARVVELAAAGCSHYEIAARTGIARSTVQRWLKRSRPPGRGGDLSAGRAIVDPAAYCYVLGVYLGDGHIDHRPPNGWTLKISCDRQYESVTAEIARAVEIVFPGRRAHRRRMPTSALEIVSISHPAIGRALPQHGSGHKHERVIALAGWQLELTHCHPGALVRGLIHSAGCRCINRVRTRLPSGRLTEYTYVRYFFTNYSADIRAIFRSHAELLGLRVTAPSPRNLAVSHQASVEVLERIVGPKS